MGWAQREILVLCYTVFMDQYRSHDLWLTEQSTIKKLGQEQPELLEWVGQFRHQDILRHIGITTIPDNLPNGYIRLRPEDFIVEEIGPDGQLCTIDLADRPLVENTDHRTVYCQMIKIGIATPEALERLAVATRLDRRHLGFAGIKDAGAITSQNISIRGTSYEQLQQASIEAVHLKNFRYGSGAISNGNLLGNRFTLTIRTEQPIEGVWLEDQLKTIRAGVPNYYGTQRFGNRWLSHYFGRLILQGKYEAAVWSFLTDVNAGERKYLALARQHLRERGHDWGFAEQEFGRFAYTFQHELTVVRHLQEHPDDWIGALTSISEQTRLWVYAYMSWLLNQTMSDRITLNQSLPNTLPIALSTNPNDRQPYRALLERDEVLENYIDNLRPLPFIRPQSRSLETVIRPDNVTARIHDVGCILSFDLPTGAYATTILMHLFTLFSSQPAPTWVLSNELDPKAFLGAGSIQALKNQYGKYFNSKSVTEIE